MLLHTRGGDDLAAVTDKTDRRSQTQWRYSH